MKDSHRIQREVTLALMQATQKEIEQIVLRLPTGRARELVTDSNILFIQATHLVKEELEK